MSSSPEYYMQSHERCPVCNREMKHVQRLSRPCEIANNRTMSYLESYCLNDDAQNVILGIMQHDFFQVSSLYGERYFESVVFPDLKRRVEINYISTTSKISYWKGSPASTLEFKNRLLEFDYPKLEKIKEKTNILAPFL